MFAPKHTQKLIVRIFVLAIAVCLVLTTFLSGGASEAIGESTIRLLENTVKTNINKYFNSSVLYKLPENIREDQTISLIVQVKSPSLLDTYEAQGSKVDFTRFSVSEDADRIRADISREKAALLNKLDRAGLEYKTGADYSAIVSGFELVITARDFETVCRTFGNDANTYISEAYKTADTEVVENIVDVYETGIFDSSDFQYDGSGIVVAVLDTGIDYTHSAFSLDNFTSKDLGMTYEDVAAVLSKTKAAELVQGLTAADVYINEKIPFAFDYADVDADAYPINSDHGTHVSGIIAGKDDTITGVAPNAQLVEMKIFSDVYDSALASWILHAVEDCVTLGVDVINMSIGTACGFARESDEEFISGVYQRIQEQGISLVVAASNSYNSTYASEKNGNLGLTSNPDSGTVGSPSTYEAAMSVASVSGVPTPYLTYNGKVIYFTESVDRISEEKEFVKELLGDSDEDIEIEYILVPGAGRSADYTGLDVQGKIVLVARGSTTFEEKAAVAQKMGAAGLIIYNNVSGDIRMNVGDATIPVCSISQDNGELLAQAGSGKIVISKKQTAGPFISDYSSWGPTPSLQIKPEITAHGGSILSAVPGQDYDRQSGTSMACPNVAGITALLRQYVKENFPDIAEDNVAVTTMVNRLMMSTADILLNQNGNPYSVRKQGAGLANLNNCANTTAYIMTYDADGNVMTKPKLELGDDADKKGVYTMTFSVVNFGDGNLNFDLSAYVMTEGVSDTKTSHGETTVTEEAYILNGAAVTVKSTDGKGGYIQGSRVCVFAGDSLDVTVTITLGDEDKAYLDQSFANGMYVEGFIVLDAVEEGAVDLNVPYLAFYGDWTLAPLFDLTYFDTNADELDLSLDAQDKTMADAYASIPIGGIYSDYVSYLGSYYFEQDPSANQIAASMDHISLTNQTDGVNALRFVWAGMLRSAAEVRITITDDATGEVVFERLETDVRKSYGDGGSIYPSNIDVEFSAIEHNLKNNTRYTVTLTGKLDYGDGGAETNKNNTITFPLYMDFQAPAITDCEFYTEYDATAKKTRYFARMHVYDNHYAMGLQIGYVGLDAEGSYLLTAFDQYLTPVYSTFNATTEVVYELTDHIDQIRTGSSTPNTITVACYDYALNFATYEISLPHDFIDIEFAEEEIVLSPNQVVELAPMVYPAGEWSALLEYYCTSPASGEVARVVNNKLVTVAPGSCVIIARDPETKKQATMRLTVLDEDDEGYKRYDKPVLDVFELTGYTTGRAYYFMDTKDRDIGMAGDTRKFLNGQYTLSMYPSEKVTLEYLLYAYFEEDTKVVFSSSNDKIVTVDQNGTVTAVAEGFASISLQVTQDGKNTYYSKSISVNVKDPYVTSGPTLTNYYGLGDNVVIPDSLHITAIGDYAFANFNYVDKTEDDFDYDDKSATKITYIGDDTITSVVIPEGVTSIGEYAFANLTRLTKVVLPSTIERIDQGAFYGCTNLTTVEGLENVKFLNRSAFEGCKLSGALSLDSCVAIADRVFAGNKKLESVTLSPATRSIGAYAFQGCSSLKSVEIQAANVKIGNYVFTDCDALAEITLNTAVVSRGAFFGCGKLKTVHLGNDVSVIAEYAFGETGLKELIIDSANPCFKVSADGTYVTNSDGTQLMLVLPSVNGTFTLNDPKITYVAAGALSGCSKITAVEMHYVTGVGSYAFAGCERLRSVTLGKLTEIGAYAFYECGITKLPDVSAVVSIGEYAFARSGLTDVVLPDRITVGAYAFADCQDLESITVGDGVVLREGAFYLNSNENWTSSYYTVDGQRYYAYLFKSPIRNLTIGNGVTIGDKAFYGAAELETVTLGSGATIGAYAFYNNSSLKDIDLSQVLSIGEYAFSGDVLYMGTDSSFSNYAIDENGYYMYSYHASMLTEIDLSAAAEIGAWSFAYCKELARVNLGSAITELPESVFNMCSSLAQIDLSCIVKIGSYALAETALTAADLSSAGTVGDYAFYNCGAMTSVKLDPNGVTLGEGAFAYNHLLTDLTGEEYATGIGDYAFAYTALLEVDLTAAEHIGTHAFMKETAAPLTVTLGTALRSLGDNPFAMCRVAPFLQLSETQFNGVTYTTPVYSYVISDTVQVIDGSIYQAVPSGMELVTYAGTEDRLTLPAGTVRISAMAFAGSDVRTVTLPYTLNAIGHKAFYGCNKLASVAFTSYDAPILEEEYDYMYFLSFDHISGSGQYSFVDTDGVTPVEKEGLGITPYFLWNAAENPTSIYYGATFVDYIGHYEADLVMVRPVNGQNYDSFIMSKYFALAMDGAAAADDLTQAAIDAINALPDTVRLEDKDAVAAARKAYDLISTREQQALVTNYSKLTQAEKRIQDLEFLANDTQEPAEDPVEPEKTGPVWLVVLLCVLVLPAALILTATALKAKSEKSSFGKALASLFPKKKKDEE